MGVVSPRLFVLWKQLNGGGTRSYLHRLATVLHLAQRQRWSRSSQPHTLIFQLTLLVVVSEKKKKKKQASIMSKDDKESSSKATTSAWDLTAKVTQFMDEQRLERLKQCQEIEQYYKHCQERRRAMLAKHQEPIPQEWNVEECIPGTRMARYFGWHKETPPSEGPISSLFHDNLNALAEEPSRETFIEDTTTGTQNDTIPSCAKEAHSLWACRSVGLGCASHLSELKACFDSTPDILTTPETAYEQTPANKVVPCQVQQEHLGKCVVQQAKELQRRLDQSNNRTKET